MIYTAHDRARLIAEDPARSYPDRDDFVRDRARIVHSSALRRLSAKTQVVDPARDDFSRNRLTHSLEVAQIGRELAEFLGCSSDVVDSACLAHDLGHPPFGHTGEAELNELARDFGGFEGNAQTLRLLTRLEPKRCDAEGNPVGLNLTRATLDASVKYPWLRNQARYHTIKFGVYEHDRAVFDWLRQNAPSHQRCLEAQVMDWADDVAYSVHDVEDALLSGAVTPSAVREPEHRERVIETAHRDYASGLDIEMLEQTWDQFIGSGALPSTFDGSYLHVARLKDMTSSLIGHFVRAALVATRERFGDGPLIRYRAELVIPDEAQAQCALLKAVASYFVMQAKVHVDRTVRQRGVIADLFHWICEDPQARLDAHWVVDWQQADTQEAGLRVIVDQIACLTDARAWRLHAAVS